MFESRLGIQGVNFGFELIRHQRLMGGESEIDQLLAVKMGASTKGVDKWNLMLNVSNLPDDIVTGDNALQDFIKRLKARAE